MGSRGAFIKAGGFKEYRYKTVIRYNNVRYVSQTDGKSVKIPERSNSPWVIYATLSRTGELQSISFYRGDRKLYKEIDFLHSHNGIKVHVHEIDPLSKSFRTGVTRLPTTREQSKIRQIQNFYNRHKVKELMYEK